MLLVAAGRSYNGEYGHLFYVDLNATIFLLLKFLWHSMMGRHIFHTNYIAR